MKNYISKKVLLISVFLSLFSFLISAAPYDEVFNNAVALWNGGAQKEACTEFKRYIFVIEANNTKVDFSKYRECYTCLSSYYESKGDLYLAMEYQQMIKNLQPVEADCLREIELYRKLGKLEKRSLEKELDLWCFRYMSGYSQLVSATAGRVVLCSLMDCNNWDSFSEYYNQFILDFPTDFSQEEKTVIEDTLVKLKKAKLKKPMLAAHLSFIPGLGQLYAGDVKDSLNAFVLNGGIITLSTFTICTGNYTEFSFFEMNPLYRFYRGNIYNAQKDTYRFNNNKIKKIKAPMEKILEP